MAHHPSLFGGSIRDSTFGKRWPACKRLDPSWVGVKVFSIIFNMSILMLLYLKECVFWMVFFMPLVDGKAQLGCPQ